MKKLTTLLLSLSALVALGDEAVHVDSSIRTPIPRRNLKLAPSGHEYYVSVQGDDRNPGTREEPFRNIQRFADIAQPGDICLVREGTYRETKTLYLWAPDGKSPAEHAVEVKVRDRAFEVNDLNEIHLIGFHFFASTFQFEKTVHSLVDDCHLLFPTYARELHDSRHGGSAPTTSMTGSHNTIRNTTLGFTPLAGLVMTGSYNTLENNLVHDVCWNGSLRYPAISMRAGDMPSNQWNPTVIMGHCVATGHAAGLAAAISAKHGIMPRDVKVAEIQGALRRDGVDLTVGGKVQENVSGDRKA